MRFAAKAVTASLVLTASLAVATGPHASAADAPEVARTDQRPSGNRVAVGWGPLSGWLDVQLPEPATWVLSEPRGRGDAWLAVSADGSVWQVVAGPDGSTLAEPFTRLPAGEPPVARIGPDGSLDMASALDDARRPGDVLPGARTVETDGGGWVVLAAPTDRYPHGVLGDDLEAGALVLISADGVETRVSVGPPEVVEGLAPIVADLDDDGAPEILVTVSHDEAGARLVAYGLDGREIAASEPIGIGYHWLHQIGVDRLGPSGEPEIIVVRTPHIGGTVQAFRLEGDRLEVVAELPGFSSHVLGSSNLDMALLADATGDGRTDVIVPTQAMDALAVMERTEAGFESVLLLPLDGRLNSNVAVTADDEGRLVLAAGTDDGRLRIFR